MLRRGVGAVLVAFAVVLFLGFFPASHASGLHKRVLMIIAPENFRDEELFVTKRVLESRGVLVSVASVRRGMATGMLGGVFRVELTFDAVDPGSFDAVILVGGSGARIFWDDPAVHRLLKDAYHKGAVVGAICISPVTLCRAGLLRGRKATVWGGVSRILRRCGARYTGKDVEIDGHIVTANGPHAAKPFAEAVLRLMGYM